MDASPLVTPRLEKDCPTHLMTTDELRREYIRLKQINASLTEEAALLQAEIGAVCKESVRFQQSTEIEEEKRANQLLRCLHSEEMQKRQFLGLLRHEEAARQKIMGQISQVRGEKNDLESHLAQQEVVMLQLQKRLMDVVNKKNDAERELLRERRLYLDALTRELEHLKSCVFIETNERKNIGGGDDNSKEEMAETLTTETPNTEDSEVAFSSASGFAATDTNVAINCLEKKLNHLLREHAAAVRSCMRNKEDCEELGRNLDAIQKTAFLDRARASKLREELLESKRHLTELEAFTRGSSVVSDDSSRLPTPRFSSLKNMSLRGRTVEFLPVHQRQLSSSINPLCNMSEGGDDTHNMT